MTITQDAVVDEYLNQLRTSFNYTCSIPVDDVDDKDSIALPGNELAKYHLVFGTRNPKAVVLMNDIALNALGPYFDQFKSGLLFDVTPVRYERNPEAEIKNAIVQAVMKNP